MDMMSNHFMLSLFLACRKGGMKMHEFDYNNEGLLNIPSKKWSKKELAQAQERWAERESWENSCLKYPKADGVYNFILQKMKSEGLRPSSEKIAEMADIFRDFYGNRD